MELLVLGLLEITIYAITGGCTIFWPRLLSQFRLEVGLALLGAWFVLALAFDDVVTAALPPFLP